MVEDDWTIFGGVVFEIDIILICVYVLNECHVKEDAFSYEINFKNWPSLIKSSFKMQVYKYIPGIYSADWNQIKISASPEFINKWKWINFLFNK